MIPFLLPTIAVLSFVPALFILYQSLSPYTWPKSDVVHFEDTRIFTLVAAGLIIGASLFFIELLFSTGGFITTLLFLTVEELIVLVILNFPRVRRRGGTRFYGMAMGTAIAAGLIMGQYAELFRQSSQLTQLFAVLLIYSVGLELIGGSTGCIIGYSVERGTIHYGIIGGVALQAVFSFLIIPVFSFAPSVVTLGFDIAALILALISQSYVVMKLLPRINASPATQKQKRLL